ncbi:Rho termination factor N-terminal domain-containing protein [Aeromicrobium sp. NPDC092404]|uniref:Rho termination factor N-terminal domain-containing protein n=1 Tax=Aeromicrobium sp. NPDC092404 TaxID=3154976 RepID=UPI00341BBD15
MAGKTTPKPSKLERRLAVATSTVDELTAEVTVLRARVKTLEAESKAWQKRADKHKSRLQKVRGRAEKAIAEAEKAIADATARRKKAKARERQAIADHPRAEPLALRDAPLPEATWTVVQLREAARAQGVAGYSRMRKDQLLARLV